MANKLYQMTPKEIVGELDKYIIGQDEAKKSVAIALRNRYRRSLLSEEMREEITPKNILMMGPTGCGKTEIARRLAKLMDAPFVKVEATKFTEVGYVGRDVDSMVRDLVEASVRITKQAMLEEKYSVADEIVEEKAMISDGICYLDMATIHKYLNDRFYVDGGEGLLLYTLPEDIVRNSIGSSVKETAQGSEELGLICI